MADRRNFAAAEITENAVLGGRLRLRQPRRGHRVGHDAILLAAACPARAGEHVADFGAGVGAAGLALAVRVPGTTVTLLEIHAQLAMLASENVRLNALDDRVRAVAIDVTAPARSFAANGLRSESVMRVLMNPPFNDPQRQRVSPDAARRLAHVAPRQMLAVWVKAAVRLLRPRGTLTAIWRADGLSEMLTALAVGFGGITVRPVYSRPGKPAIRILVNAIKASHAPLTLLPPMLLADSSGVATPAADAVLRDGVALADV
jgi:tRNA1(Val) A37 N6-methylase TrmN6